MANIKSALKRIKIAERNRQRNKSYKSAIKTLSKKYLEAAQEYGESPTAEQSTLLQGQMAQAYSKIDKAVKCGVLHRNTGARRKAVLARALKSKSAT